MLMIKKYVEESDYVKMNLHEVSLFSGYKGDLQRSLGVAKQYSNNRVIIITDGINGSYLIYNNMVHYINAYNVNCIDSVGAGDAYYAVFLNNINTEEKRIDNLINACKVASRI